MPDIYSPAERSALMSKVRSTGNRSTEGQVEAALLTAGIAGWEKHARLGTGRSANRPDFYFPDLRLALYVDGCFWHACPVCKPTLPATRAAFWAAKIDENRRRDNRKRRMLRRAGYHVIRVWEHELRGDAWLTRLHAMLRRAERADAERPARG